MATSKEYKEFILEQLDLLDNITCRSMMGEFLLYYNNILIGGIYDNRLLVKIVDTNKKYNMVEQIPYESAKPMYLVDDVDNKELLKEMEEKHFGLPHGGSVIRTGTTGDGNKQVIEYKINLDSNPEFTGSVLVAYARAIKRMADRKEYGCKTVFDVAPSYLSPKTSQEIVKELL